MTTRDSFLLNSYTPLVASAFGRAASRERGICPFVDGSIRREPDLEHEFPSISCTCRKGKFAPRLQVGDTVGYMTVKRRYCHGEKPHRRLTAVLHVIERCESHAEAAEWYRSRGLTLPSNCMVADNPSKPLEESHMIHRARRQFAGERLLRTWDREYRLRTAEFGTFIICKSMFRSLSWDAPVVNDEQLKAAFGKIPGTQNPGIVSALGFHEFMRLLGLTVPLSVP